METVEKVKIAEESNGSENVHMPGELACFFC